MQEIKDLSTDILHINQKKRTSRILMSDEARVLRELRQRKGLSMRALGALINKSDSYVSQIENGRLDVPVDASLEAYLAAVGGLTQKSFYERVRRFRLEKRKSIQDELIELVKRINDTQAKQILILAKMIIAAEIY